MTPGACSVHTHSVLCDGKNTLPEMAAAAFAAGVRYFGVSGHSHTPIPWDEGNTLPSDPAEYRAQALRLRAEYEGRMEVLLGIEQDSCSLQPVPSWADYWIGSVHNLRVGGAYACVDWDAEKLETGCRELFGGDYLAMAEGYYADVAAMAARRPTILGHVDLICKLNAGNRFFDEEDPRYQDSAREALHAADPRETLLEINTGGVSRGYRADPYPAFFLLREWRAMGGEIILTSDSHSTDTIVFGYDRAAELARAAGFTRAAVLTCSGRAAVSLG